MSPASHGGLEVERYIGSCLISSSSRVNKAPPSSPTAAAKGKKLVEPFSGVGAVRQRGCPDHFAGGHLGYLSLCDCRGGGGYGGNPGWAGMPLISMASNHRRNRRPGCAPGRNIHSTKGECVPPCQTRTPLSRLAIHTQGAPLILAGRYPNSAARRNPGGRIPPPMTGKQYFREPVSSRKVPPVSKSDNTVNKDANPSGVVPNPATSADTLSVASDESSGQSENSLPRIIKPRKRRKKDRKPPTATALTTDSNISTPSEDSKDTVYSDSPSIVTLKPYVPLCYDVYGSGRWDVANRRRWREGVVWETRSSLRVPPQEERPPNDPVSSEDDGTQDPKLHHDFDDVQEGECPVPTSGDLFPYSGCQCRYCDPAGGVWDVDQYRYSPFLTRPSPGHSLFPTSTGLFGEGHHDLPDSVGLRRSWSDPSSDSARHDPSSGSLCSFGVVGVSRSLEGLLGTQSQGLEVSTEIVTAPNGHRDIEIRFYSCSPPSVRSGPSADDLHSRSGSLSSEGDADKRGAVVVDARRQLGTNIWTGQGGPEVGLWGNSVRRSSVEKKDHVDESSCPLRAEE